MERNIKITVEYDGTNYSGWQIQNNTPETIQGVLSKCLFDINKSPVKLIGASRTDAGVHARGQVANFRLKVGIPVERIPLALNSKLPPDIVCKDAEEVTEDFHARFDARGKRYIYRILNSEYPSPFLRNYTYFIPHNLNIDKMREAGSLLIGEHDFASFQASGGSNKTTVRTITKLDIYRDQYQIKIEVCGNGFLYKMVRIIAGTLIEVGLGKRTVKSVGQLLEIKDRDRAGFTAPPRGLTLIEVFY
ncbi:tRNA pseudouridine(38-40) synthase TruA [Halothermothrix orenii]|uniref:tRNA pseudouridine synthase A n=1 Tax=Halothermothrix orenii (strain H 168 / OCM 544 / DSM 9562) TaxID=373903 RepID=B8D0U2_HALOH|nr:tRNA pseudouridine(38-40) synthase TruA [Halothermothrix orenii]ACL68911.1 pseudouridylate synthase I [Halothermothrix orenii H 168]ACL69006.1 pseudouridylate synthase I [Halothermothrix orenii H 168]